MTLIITRNHSPAFNIPFIFFLPESKISKIFKEQKPAEENILLQSTGTLVHPFNFVPGFSACCFSINLTLLSHTSHQFTAIYSIVTFWCFRCEFWIKTESIFWLSRGRFEWRLYFSSEQFLKGKDKDLRVNEASMSTVILSK